MHKEKKQSINQKSTPLKIKITQIDEAKKEEPLKSTPLLEEKPIEKRVVKKRTPEKKKKPLERKTEVVQKNTPPELKEIKESIKEAPKSQLPSAISKSKSVKVVDKNESKEYYATIYQEIDKNKKYPKQAIKFKQEDSIPVSFMVNGEGEIYDFKILKKSSYPSLNKAVEKIFKNVKKLQRPPLGISLPLEVKININFKLEKE